MDDMTAKHTRPDAVPHPRSPVPAMWVVLCAMGTASVACQMFHALNSGTLWPFALIEGGAPVVASMGLSHGAALLRTRWWLKAVLFAVIGGSMLLSARAIAQVTSRGEGPWGGWLFGAMLDAAALIALAVILTEHERAAERASAQAAEDSRAAVLEAEVARLSTELAARPRPVPPPASPARSRSRSRTGTPARRKRDIDTDAAALAILDAEPGISGTELGRRLKVDPSYGRALKRRLASAPQTGPLPAVPAGAPVQRVED